MLQNTEDRYPYHGKDGIFVREEPLIRRVFRSSPEQLKRPHQETLQTSTHECAVPIATKYGSDFKPKLPLKERLRDAPNKRFDSADYFMAMDSMRNRTGSQ